MNYPHKKLGDLFQISSGGTPSRKNIEYYENGTIPWVKTGDLHNKWLVAASENISEVGLSNSSAKLYPKGTVLLAMYGATIGACSILNIDAATNQACAAFTPTEEVEPEYLYYAFKANKHNFVRAGAGGAQPNISGKFLKSFEIPLPPLPIQKQIAAVLEKADNLRQQSQQMEEDLNSLAQSVFLDMFGDPAKNEKGWPIATIGDCCKSVNYGTSEKADESTGDYPVLRMNNITYDGRWNFDSLKYINLDDKGTEKYLVESGDLLFNRTNSKELVGKTAVFRENKAMAFAGYLVRARLNERAVPEYISAVMNSHYGKQTLLSMCKSIVGMANINAKEFQKIRIPIPPIALQEDFQEIILSINSKMRDIEVNKKEYKNLFNSLMQRAFKGELDLKDVA